MTGRRRAAARPRGRVRGRHLTARGQHSLCSRWTYVMDIHKNVLLMFESLHSSEGMDSQSGSSSQQVGNPAEQVGSPLYGSE
ncbi:unnamed protein product [Cylicocyclus nassatus]|uniref:Uncharacterized protein n=1 Tax=Cylicocyclus nassatus TaxID=53992 RepID=A0AA36MC12_CYLNA|nr:unnamed protein product [Cylicocyclus nassatus]